ncbi:delta 1-pyrroline-5-carboxylate reductase [Xylographa opegraphella]|nr:delta 1-pyrroline-5-carboxylate reductase [Xylographa opegraphella]
MANLLNGTNGSDAQSGDLTLTVLGCGTLGTCILSGILSSLADLQQPTLHAQQTPSGLSTPAEDLPTTIPRRFIACVTSAPSARRIEKTLAPLTDRLTVLQNENVRGAAAADVVLLGCKPYNLEAVLAEPGMRAALRGKLLISILAGVPVAQIEDTLYPPHGSGSGMDAAEEKQPRCRIVRALPNTASMLRESMTVIATSTPPLPPPLSALVTWIFTRIGPVRAINPALMDVCTALCGSGPAFFSLFMEAIADGAVAMGLPRKEALFMAAQTMKGTAALILEGEHPAILRDKVSTPGGCTIGGLLVLEEGSLRGTAARGLREATVVASQLGKGVQGVNGTRF